VEAKTTGYGQNDLFERKWKMDRSIWSGMINLENVEAQRSMA
jgi:hypothetical protein